MFEDEKLVNLDDVGTTNVFEVPNTRNNSYFGDGTMHGTSAQFVPDCDSAWKYNEPKGSSKLK